MKAVLALFLFTLASGDLPAYSAESDLSGRPPGSSDSISRELNRMFEKYFDEALVLNPAAATLYGDHRYDDRLGNPLSEEHRSREAALAERYSRELAGFDRARLNARDQLSYDAFRHELTRIAENLNYPEHWLPVGNMFDLPTAFALLGSGNSIQPFKTVADYERFLGRVKDFCEIVDTAIANMRTGMKSGVTQPRIIMEKSLKQIEPMLVDDPRKSLFYQPVLQMPTGFTQTDRARLAHAYTEAIQKQIEPAYRKLATFIRQEYLPRCRETVGWSALPNGSRWYAHHVRFYTTTSLTPDQIHELGCGEVERIGKEMEALKAESGFTGSLAAFAKQAERTAATFRSRSELVRAYEGLRAIVEPNLPRLFGHLPKSGYEIRPVEEFRETTSQSQLVPGTPDGTRRSVFYVNAAGIEQTPVSISESLFIHEAVPGHHFQIAISYESDLPKFRRFGEYEAYMEGWALYAEALGTELGCYRNAKQKLDFLASEIFRARRLVVDVGLHLKGWSRDRALNYLLEVPGMTAADAALEVDRYIAWPGQALSYKCGQLKIRAIRAKAEKNLGSKFEVRDFHDELLKDGGLPLDLLEAKMDRWSATRVVP